MDSKILEKSFYSILMVFWPPSPERTTIATVVIPVLILCTLLGARKMNNFREA